MMNLLQCFLLGTFLFSNGFGKSVLFTIDTFDSKVGEIGCCKDDYVLSCQQINVNAASLGTQNLELSTSFNETVKFMGMVGDSDHSYHYQNEKIDMVITYNAAKGSLHGHATDDSTGASYVIEFCGNNVHVLKQMDVDNMPGDSMLEAPMSDEIMEVGDTHYKDVADTTTIVTYTVKVYYTPQFKAATADIDGYVDQLIQETNQGYINSKVPIRVKLFCTELATVNDGYDILKSFERMKGTLEALRGTADTAALLIRSWYGIPESCGEAYVNTISSGWTVSVTRKDCGRYTFGHELGHNIGLTHNIEETGKVNNNFRDGQGYLIPRGSASTGYHSIMAYSFPGHREPANYYSNPNVIHPKTGTRTGVWGKANSARVLTVQRFDLAAIGDESDTSCGGGSSSTNCQVDKVYRYYTYNYIGRMGAQSCKSRCALDASCIGWVNHARNRWCYSIQAKTVQHNAYSAGPDLSKQECFLDTASCTKGNTILQKPNDYYFKMSRVTSASECHTACKQDSKCAYWIAGGANCWMYEAKYKSTRGWTSGPRFC